MFKKKNNKDQLIEVLKKNGEDFIYPFLDNASLLNLSLTGKKYYLQLAPIFTILNLEEVKQPKSEKVQKSKPKEKKQIKQNPQSNKPQIQVEIEKVSIWKAKKEFNKGEWNKIQELPFDNAYLQKKMENGIAFFYQNNKTEEIVFINRSLVDPNLAYNHGGFQADESSQSFYEELLDDELNEIDFSSLEALKSRQKQVLERIEKKKEKIQKLQEIDYSEELDKALNCKKIAVILCFGGSFSFGVFQNNKCILHKSDKKYVCRKKAGQRQLNKDKASGQTIQSMGSQIRRDQEKKHIQNVGQILMENKKSIEECDLVFLQAPGLNRLFIINANETLSGCKDRLRSVCLTAKKANYTEVEGVFNEITKVSFVKAKKP